MSFNFQLLIFPDKLIFLAILLCGYSLFSAPVLVLTHFRGESYVAQPLQRMLGAGFVLSLGALQLFHYFYLMGLTNLVHGGWYIVLLFSIAPLFYLFSQPLIKAQTRYSLWQLLHFLPLFPAFCLPYAQAWSLAFVIGTLYLIQLIRQIYALRAYRHQFHLELGFLTGIVVIAINVSVLVFLIPLISETTFFTLYASAIGGAFLLINLTFFYAPQMKEQIEAVARDAYVSSTLVNVNCDEMLIRFDQLMEQEHIFKDPDLDLPMMARRLGLSNHQLSELVNVKLGKGFSRHVREYRINAAKAMLLNEPGASVLSIGLSIGFSSQSNFYTAFREVTGMTPGQFRKISKPIAPE
jgi:AraC-like DNA-binding protein